MTGKMKRWLSGFSIALMAWTATPGNAAGGNADVLYEGTPIEGTVSLGRRMVAKAEPRLLPVPAGRGLAQANIATSTGERINMIFAKPDQDIITQQALEKLNVMIESLEFANADLQNVIRIIGERLNINFIFDAQDINGKVTLRLHNVRLKDALDSILTSRKLGIIADRSGIFRIVTDDRMGRKQVETKTEVLQLNWISAEDALKTLKPFITEGVGKIEFNQESNSLILNDVPPQVEIIKDLITQLDKPERQVLIEARLVDINMGMLRELGTKWSATTVNRDAISTHKTFTAGSPAVGATAETPSKTVVDKFLGGSLFSSETVQKLADGTVVGSASIPPAYGAGGAAMTLLNGLDFSKGTGTVNFGEKVGIFGKQYDLNATFTALDNKNIVQILANPRVMTLNNVPAKINLMEKIPYIQASGMTSTGTSVPTIAFEDAGVDISVKPIITPNGYVRMEIVLKQSIFRGRVGTNALDPPQIDRRDASTTAIAADSETVVLGGLRQLRRSEQMNGVPWLSQIPLIGWLFKDKNYDQSKIELVLMMTPRIVQDNLKLTPHEKELYAQIDNNWHLPDNFFDDVKGPLDKKQADNKAETKTE